MGDTLGCVNRKSSTEKRELSKGQKSTSQSGELLFIRALWEKIGLACLRTEKDAESPDGIGLGESEESKTGQVGRGLVM